jgi:hypothetical protein
MRLYPEYTGLKVMNHFGGIDTDYVNGSKAYLYQAASYGHRHLLLVAQYLYDSNCGPELRDLMEIQVGPQTLLAYAIEHIPEPATCPQSEAVIARLRDLVGAGELLCTAPKGFAHEDFLPPSFGDNVRKRSGSQGQAVYIDYQNFALGDYGKYLEHIARTAVEATHFGDEFLLKGGRHLYQRIPGVPLPAKRDLQRRMQIVDGLLSDAGESIADRVVLDIGCNLGMAIAEYLRREARWCFGWDLDTTVSHSKRILRAVGCTRFSLFGRDLNEQGDLGQDLPPLETECVISYLAIRKHIGWHPSLFTLPWTTMIYEGHEGEDTERSLRFLRDLGDRIPIEAIHHCLQRDYTPRERFVAVVKRAS